MSEHERRRARERAELEAEFRRLDAVYDVLADMSDAAWKVSQAKDYRDIEFEAGRAQSVRPALGQVHAERSAVRDRLLDYEFPPDRAARIRAGLAERQRERDQRRAGVERSR